MKRLLLIMAAVLLSVSAVVTACTDPNTPNEDPGNDPVKEVEIESMTIDPDKAEMKVGETLELALKTVPENASIGDVQLFSNNPNAVEIQGLSVKALAKGNVTITAAASNGVQATCSITIVEEQNEGPDDPEDPDDPVYNVPDSTSWNIEFHGSYTNEFEITVDASVETVRYFLWCEEASVLEQLGIDNDEAIIAHDKAILEQIRLDACEEEGREVTLQQVLAQYTYVGTQDRRISPIVEGYLELKPATKYYVYIYGMELDGTVTTEIFTFDQTTSAEIGTDDEYDVIMAFTTGFYQPSGSECRIKLGTSGMEELNFYIVPSAMESLTGVYTSEEGTFNINYSSFYYTDKTGPVDVPFDDAVVNITQDGDVFDILCTGTLMSGKKVNLSYFGTLEFRQ